MLNISNFPWSECAIVENRIQYNADSLSLKRTIRGTNTHRYEFELVTYEMDLSEGRGVLAKISRAVKDTLLYTHPRLSYSQGTVPIGGLALANPHVAGDDEIQAYSGALWQLKAGDYLQIGTDTKVYQCARDTALSSGTKTVELTSPLRYTMSDASTVIANGVTWYLTSNGVIETGGMVASEGQDMQITLIAVEKL